MTTVVLKCEVIVHLRNLGVACALVLAFSPMPAFAQDADADLDGVGDVADAFPCDNGAAGELYAPGDGTHGTLAYEDQWPNKGDSDFNDAVINYNYVARTDANGDVVSLRATYSARALGGTIAVGFGLHLPVAAGSVQSVTRRIGNGPAEPIMVSTADAEATFIVSRDLRQELYAGASMQVNSRPDLATQSGLPIEVEVIFNAPTPLNFAAAPFDPYLFRTGDQSHEIHGPKFTGTAAMNTALFNTQYDGSSPGRSFVGTSGIPFMLDLPQSWVWPQEGVVISSAYPNITNFGQSGGTTNQDWYTSHIPSFVYAASSGATLPNPTFITGPRFVSDSSCVCSQAQQVVFDATGSQGLFIVPVGVTQVTVRAWGGAGGGSNAEGRRFPGGPGGYASGTLAVTPGEALTVLVGQGGLQTTNGQVRAFPNGGLAGRRSGYTMGHGGGRSALQRGSQELLVAGGGGGAGGTGWSSNRSTAGGAGGGLTGGDGSWATDGQDRSNCVGFGGTQSAGGVGGFCTGPYTGVAGPGSKNQGGDGVDFGAGGNSSGGGGDGYYGGGAAVLHGGGGGGSGFLDATYVSNGILQGSSSAQPAFNNIAEYAGGIAVGTANSSGGNGRLVISYNGPCVCQTALQSFSGVGADQSFTVPANVVRIRAKVWAAAGGGSNAEGRQFPGGAGGFVTGIIDVTPGETLTIKVGAGGRRSISGLITAYPHGGQSGLRSNYTMGHGGGRSAIERGGIELLVAGAGGGAGGTGWSSSRSTSGGGGGGTSGGNGGWATEGPNRAACAGQGATQTAGGVGGNCGSVGNPGIKNGGGDGPSSNSGGGGGDGYFGGGAGAVHAGGGGGSGFTHATLVAEGSMNAASGNSSPPNTNDTNYPGGNIGRGTANGDGGAGAVIILNHQYGACPGM